MLAVNSSSTKMYVNASKIRRTESMMHTNANEIVRTNTKALRRTDTKIYANSVRIRPKHLNAMNSLTSPQQSSS